MKKIVTILLYLIGLITLLLVGFVLSGGFSGIVFCGSPYYLVKAVSPKIQEEDSANVYPSRPVFKSESHNSFNDFSLPLPEGSCIETTARCNGNQLIADNFALTLLLKNKNSFCSEEDFDEMKWTIVKLYTPIITYITLVVFLIRKLLRLKNKNIKCNEKR